MVASTMIAQALRLYKSTLTEQEYRDMIRVVLKHQRQLNLLL
jgi:hypothetical protein